MAGVEALPPQLKDDERASTSARTCVSEKVLSHVRPAEALSPPAQTHEALSSSTSADMLESALCSILLARMAGASHHTNEKVLSTHLCLPGPITAGD